MKFNETKAIIKLAEKTEDEKLKEFLVKHYLEDDEEPKEEKEEKKEVEVKEETKKEVKEEPQTKKEEPKPQENEQLAELLKSMKVELDELKKTVKEYEEKEPKLKTFGAQQKQQKGEVKASFDDVFAKLKSSQGQTY